jgi:hypothetical protein
MQWTLSNSLAKNHKHQFKNDGNEVAIDTIEIAQRTACNI